MSWRILCDFDGTIAKCDVTDSLLNTFSLPGWEEIEEEWLSGSIGSRECMRRQVELIRAPQQELDAHLDSIEIDPAFPAFAEFCQRQNIPLTIVSDGLDYSIYRILSRVGLEHLPIIANRLVFHGGDQYHLEFPYSDPACHKASGTCKCAIGRSISPDAPQPRRLLIGDGSSDFCAAGQVDFVFAKDKLLRYCISNEIPHVAFGDFHRATGYLSDLLADML